MAKLRNPFNLYLFTITMAGVILIIVGLFTIPSYSNYFNFLLLLVLGVLTSVATTSTAVANKSGISYDLHNAVAIATLPLFGPGAAILIVMAANISMWLFKPADETWRKSFPQLTFNLGMFCISMAAAGTAFLFLRNLLGAGTVLGGILPWLFAALVYGQVNVWLLIGVLSLQKGVAIEPFKMWREQWWAVAIDGAVMAFGGAVLAYAATEFDWTGIVIFFLPVLLSAFAFRVYVNRMRVQLGNLEAIVEERTKELQVLLREKDAFLAVLTHDMKTPLTSIGLYTDMLRKRPELLIERPHMLDHFTRSQISLLEIVNNILDLANLESGEGFSLNKESLELVPMLELQIELIAPQAEDRKIDLSFNHVNQKLVVLADRDKLQRIFQNLLSNAVKYTAEGGNVVIEVSTAGEDVLISVRDSGYGIPADELPHIFQPYRRVDKHKALAMGTGLGLAITKGLIEAHGGQIEVTSEEAVGSTFLVRLPMYDKAGLMGWTAEAVKVN